MAKSSKALVKAKPKTSIKAVVKAKPKARKVIVGPHPWLYDPPPERRTYNDFLRAPALDPETRQVLVQLEDRVKQFHNLEERINELVGQVVAMENEVKNATIPDTWWQRLQFAVTTLQKEFHDRVGLLERSFDAVQNLVCRMDRLEKRMNDFENRPGRTDASSND